MKEKSNMELIEKYIFLQLSEEEEHLFNERLNTKPEFKEELELAVQMNKMQIEKDRAEFIDLLEKAKKSVRDKKLKQQEEQNNNAVEQTLTQPTSNTKVKSLDKPQKSGSRIWTRIAAIALLFALPYLGYSLFLNNQIDQLLNNEIAQKAPSATTRSDGLQAEWMSAFHNKNYTKAIQQFEKLPNPDNEVMYYWGLSYFYKENYPKAIEQFDLLLKKPNKKFKEAAQWYKSLALLKSDQREIAKTELSKIIKNKTWQYKTAEELLTKLNRKKYFLF